MLGKEKYLIVKFVWQTFFFTRANVKKESFSINIDPKNKREQETLWRYFFSCENFNLISCTLYRLIGLSFWMSLLKLLFHIIILWDVRESDFCLICLPFWQYNFDFYSILEWKGGKLCSFFDNSLYLDSRIATIAGKVLKWLTRCSAILVHL